MITVLLAGCAAPVYEAQRDGGRLKIVATIFPVFDFTRHIVGGNADVTLLLRGGSAHDFDPSPADIRRVADADLFIRTSDFAEPWSDVIVGSLGSAAPSVVSAAEGILTLTDHHGDRDPHVWLDPTLAAQMVSAIADAVAAADSENADFYRENAAALTYSLLELDARIQAVVDASPVNAVAIADFNAYAYFMERYGLEYVTALDSCGKHAEPSFEQIRRFLGFVRHHELNAVFYSESTGRGMADMIAAETGADVLMFSTAHTAANPENDTYISIMNRNLQNLEKGLTR